MNSSVIRRAILQRSRITLAPMPRFRAFAAVGAATTGTVVSAVLPTRSNDDILLLSAICRDTNTAFSAVTGFTEITQFNVDVHRVGFWWKRVVGGETNPVVTNAGRANTSLLAAQLLSYASCKKTGTPYEGLGNNASASGPMLGVLVSTTGRMRLAVQAWIRAANTASVPSAGWDENLDQGTSGGGGCRFMADSAPAGYAGQVAACSRVATAPYGMIGLALIGETD